MHTLRCLLVVTLVLPLAAVWAEEPQEVDADETLRRAVAACATDLVDAMSLAYGSGRHPLEAGFVMDTSDRLLLRALVRVKTKDRTSYEAWTGPVHDGGWIPLRRVLEDEAAVARARRLAARLDVDPQAFRNALGAALRTEEHPERPADVVLSATLVARGDESVVRLRVGADGRVRALTFDVATSKLAEVALGEAPKRVPPEARSLPELEVPDGTWFNTEGRTPTLAGWRGSPVLVLVTDPG